MKKIRFLLLLVICICSIKGLAYSFEVDGICYEWVGKSDPSLAWDDMVYVTYKYQDEYRDIPSYFKFENTDIVIPEIVIHGGHSYTVIGIESKAFYACNITSITIPKSCISIGNHAFAYCRDLRTITHLCPDTLKYVGDYAFSGCTRLTSFICAKTEVSDGLYKGCSSLTSVVIPNTVEKIGEKAFFNAGLTSITLPESLTTIGDYVFANCTNLITVTHLCPDTLRYVGDYAFSGCTKLTSFICAQTEVALGLYEGCGSLTSIVIPNTVEKISEKAFFNAGLTSVILPESLTTIGDYAFVGCPLTSLFVSKNVTEIGKNVFSGCSELRHVVWNVKQCKEWNPYDGPFVTKKYNPYMSIDPNPAQYIQTFTFGADAEHIPDNLCQGMSSLDTIRIPDNIITVGDSAFFECSNVRYVSFGRNVKKVGFKAFAQCKNITCTNTEDIAGWCGIDWDTYRSVNDNIISYIISHDNPMSISGNLYLHDSLVTDLIIPDSVEFISNAFYRCKSLTSVTIGKNVKRISHEAFDQCYNIKKTTYTGDMKGWCSIAMYCNGGTPYGSNPTRFSHNLYINDTLVTNIVVPEGVEILYDGVFSFLDSVQTVTLPNSLKQIQNCVFWGCSNLSSITIPINVESIGQGSIDCGQSGSDIGPRMNEITWNAKNCIFVDDWDNVLYHPCFDFDFRFIIGSEVESLPDYLFSCSAPHEIVSYAIIPPIFNNKVSGDSFVHKNIEKIYVPCNATKDYQEQWGKFVGSIIEPDAPFQLQLNSMEEKEGSVQIDSYPDCNSIVSFSALPKKGYLFEKWSDGNTDNPRTLLLTEDTSLSAFFVKQETAITTAKEDRASISYKYLHEGKIIIVRGEKEYDIMGNRL